MAAKQQQLGFIENFSLSGAAAVISKTAAAPIERVKLLVQNQDEMLKTGRLKEPYRGVIDCTIRTYRTEGTQLIDSLLKAGLCKWVYCYLKVHTLKQLHGFTWRDEGMPPPPPPPPQKKKGYMYPVVCKATHPTLAHYNFNLLIVGS